MRDRAAVTERRAALGRRLRGAREHAALTLEQVAVKVGRNYSFVHAAERGAAKVDDAYAAQVFESCGVSADWSPAEGWSPTFVVRSPKKAFPTWAIRLNASISGRRRQGKDVQVKGPAFLVALWSKQEGRCFYTGLPMLTDAKGSPYSVSVDRRDSSVGYVEGNVVLCLMAINFMKNDWSEGELRILLDDLAGRFAVSRAS